MENIPQDTLSELRAQLNDIELVLASQGYPKKFYEQSLLNQVISLVKVVESQKVLLSKLN